ncbi:LysR family transcriptional regulator [Mesorhizobium caraganae]|uniref:LysR substrate-binding domain-containing protein n=1 Tax=Mesorhizobium caraganae TaxID=483206 RepID=UPI001785D18E|nr:LysR substrate-binding domain-containing protein [Mesorhizobium caraganae]MBM2712950.1 LysR family transcriptional regulator [Mesorhizobium caraganae]
MRYADLEIDLLRAFVAVADAGGFSAAAPLVGRSQSAVSQKVLRLEGILGQRMFDRNSRSLGLTLEGEKLLAAARQMIEFNDKVVRELREPRVEGTLRLAISEDAIPRQLPGILARFARIYPRVQVDVTTGLSCNLVAAFDEGKFDAVIAKKDRTSHRGRTIWREALTWMARSDYVMEAKPIRLVMLPIPCSYRALMIDRLSQANLDWRISCTVSSLLGAQAAVEGGLGVTVLGSSFLGRGMRALTADEGWPALPQMEIVILSEGAQTTELVRPLVNFLTDNLVVSGDNAPDRIGRDVSYLHA